MGEIREALVWCDPPQRQNVPWKARVAPLAERPGEWARLRFFGHESDAYDALRRIVRLDGYEAVVRKVNGAGFGLWARFVGDG